MCRAFGVDKILAPHWDAVPRLKQSLSISWTCPTHSVATPSGSPGGEVFAFYLKARGKEAIFDNTAHCGLGPGSDGAWRVLS
jgi:hypothetical protein